MLAFFRRLYAAQQSLKHYIHNTRIPLSPTGQKVMGLVYFTIPVVGGVYLMDKVSAISDAKWNINKEEGTYTVPKEVEESLGKDNLNKYRNIGRESLDLAVQEKITMDKLVYGKQV